MAETDIITSKAASPIGNVITYACLKIIFSIRANPLILEISLNEIKEKKYKFGADT